jgi:predicted metal-dependent phosphoesterase TrpH
MRVDLHIHTTASDGRWLPAQLVEQVRRAGIDLFAVADHDAVDSLRPIEDLVCGSGPAFIPGVEVSSTLEGRLVHLLGYGIDPDSLPLLAMLSENREKMDSVDLQSIQKLIDAGYPIGYDDYHRYENDVTRGGWKALNLFIDRGFCRDVHGFFGRLFVDDMALSMPVFVAPEAAIDLIHRSGGLAICAHPGYSVSDEAHALLDQLAERGIDGLECYSPYHDSQMTRQLADYCRQRDLLITAGSDCHGGFAGRALGQPEVDSADLDLGPLPGFAIH